MFSAILLNVMAPLKRQTVDKRASLLFLDFNDDERISTSTSGVGRRQSGFAAAAVFAGVDGF
jgi:hypothetical protein